MSRARSHRFWPVLLATLACTGCREPATAVHGPAGLSDENAAATGTAEEDRGEKPVAGASLQIRVDAKALRVGDVSLGPMLPASAPGTLLDDYTTTYAWPPLEAHANLGVPVRAEFEPTAPVANVRSVWASVLAPGATGTLVLPDGAPVELRRAPASTGPSIYLRWRKSGWELRAAETLEATATAVEGLVAALIALPPGTTADGVAIDLPDDARVSDLLAAVVAVADAKLGPAILASDFDPCLQPPEGMTCVPGGPAVVGEDGRFKEEAPRREVILSTFYIDQRETTNADYDRCYASGACKIRINRSQNIMKPFVGPEQPAMPMDWHRARAYCAWQGKQLPTEWEWEKAARGPDGDVYPWGDDEPTCDKAIYRECAPHGCTPYPGKSHPWDCDAHNTKPVGSFPPGHYDLLDMSGNGYEWTRSAAAETIEQCGDACNGRDPQGPCDGAFPCNGQRVLKGGSWYWPKHRVRGAHRRFEKLVTGSHRLGMRCVSPTPFTRHYPPLHIATPHEPQPLPEPPSTEQLAIFEAVADDAIEEKPICNAKVREQWGGAQVSGGRSETTCRDPFPYLMTNEPRAYLWGPYIENLGGAYVGIGSDQNYSHIAAARPEWAWVVDYDPRVYKNHLRLAAFVRAAADRKAFVALFAAGAERRALEILSEAYGDADDVQSLRRGYSATRAELEPYFAAKLKPSKAAPDFGWLATDANYAFIKTLFEQRRMRPVKGDLLADGALRSIGRAAHDLGVPIRIYYTSNAPSSWGGNVTAEYRDNVLSLPMDSWSIVLQTNSHGGFAQTGKWHHNVTWGLVHQERLRKPGYDSIPKLLEDSIPGHDGDVTMLGIPSPAVLQSPPYVLARPNPG